MTEAEELERIARVRRMIKVQMAAIDAMAFPDSEAKAAADARLRSMAGTLRDLAAREATLRGG